jgi:Mrp family chromosome partitioning ATPase/capsular polysaccharide biosynthesis protein
LNVLRRRKWVIIYAVALVQLLSVLYMSRQTPVYQAKADVLLSRQSLANSLNGLQDPTLSVQPDRFPQTQADIARSPEVASRVLARLHLADRTVEQFLASSSVTPAQNADVLTFTVRDQDPRLAFRMAGAYAVQYRAYLLRLETQALQTARLQVQRRIDALGKREGLLYTSLVERDQQLSTMEALLTSQASVIDTPTSATQVSPRPIRSGVLALVLGLVFGIGLAFLRETLDTRIRSASEVGDRLQVPMLARIPQPSARLQAENKLAMLSEPSGSQAEAFRMLRTNLEFTMLGRDVRSVLITSALEREGKSTTIANLAVALARSGQNVLLVDLDLRRPYIDRFFNLHGRPGITQVALGRVSLVDALVEASITPIEPGHDSGARYDLSRNGSTGVNGRLQILGSGPIPPDPGEFVASAALSQVFTQLRDVADIVLVDAPPLLPVGDAMALSARVDGLILATRMEILRRPMLDDVKRLLGNAPSRTLGFVVTGAETEDGYGYGYGSHAYAYRSPPQAHPAELTRTT